MNYSFVIRFKIIKKDEFEGGKLTVFGIATFADNCPASVMVVEDVIENLNVCDVGVITRTWTATDNCGNSGTYVQTINIKDNTNPTITCPATQNQNAPNGTDTTLLDYTSMASISDNCSDSANITVTQFPAIGSTQNVGTTNVVLTAIDECGNFAICAFDVTITNTVGIAENKNVAVTIFPNPNKGLFTINLGTEISGKTNIQVYNVLGEIVYNVNKEDGNAIYELNLQHVDKGIYYVNVQGEQKTIVKKIMIM